MPHAIVIQCVPREPLPADAPNGAQLHAAFLHLLRSRNPQLAAELHDGNVLRNYAVSFLRAWRNVGGDNHRQVSEMKLRVACLDDRIYPVLSQWANASLEQGLIFRLGQVQWEMTRMMASNMGGEPWAGHASFEELAGRASEQQTIIRIEFTTPTVFSQGDREEAAPLPRHVFGALFRRWNASCPGKLQMEAENADEFLRRIEESVVLSHPFEFCSAIADLGDQLKLTGFVGYATYRIRRKTDPAFVRLINLLADAAFFTGLGKKTSRGCGTARRTPTKD
jgi:CRISPR-associated endoribonuclease Cas6